MTTQAEVATDPITQDQEQLDTQSAVAAPLTAEQIADIVRAQVAPLQSQISGVQSLHDRGLNAIRSDMQRQVDARVEELRREKFLSELPEDATPRQVANALLEYQKEPAQEPVRQQEPVQNAWEAVYQYVEDFGLKRDDPKINYSLLVNPALSAQDRQKQFHANIAQVMQTPAPQPPSQPPSQPPTGNPPVPAGGGTGNSLTTVDDVRDAFIENRLTTDEFKEKMAALGEPV